MSGTHRWLGVDGDPGLLKLTADVLRAASGKEVIACNHPREALDVFFAVCLA